MKANRVTKTSREACSVMRIEHVIKADHLEKVVCYLSYLDPKKKLTAKAVREKLEILLWSQGNTYFDYFCDHGPEGGVTEGHRETTRRLFPSFYPAKEAA